MNHSVSRPTCQSVMILGRNEGRVIKANYLLVMSLDLLDFFSIFRIVNSNVSFEIPCGYVLSIRADANHFDLSILIVHL